MKMEEGGKWEVTYTKHVKQKRKVYHDGFLHLLSNNNNKVILYDNCDQLLDSKLLKNDECVQTGDSLLFASFLVDIGPLISVSNPNSATNTSPYANKKPNTTARRKTSANSLSPSQKIIREFQKKQVVKYTAHHSPSTVSPSSSKEWEALYTTQITQKVKKYHDGFIRLIISGSQGRQVALYDSNKTQIDKRFLKKDEVICSGETLKLDGHLVDIGDALGNKEIDAGIKTQASNCSSDKVESGQQMHNMSKENLAHNQQSFKVPTRQKRLGTENALAIGRAQSDVGASKCGDLGLDVSRMKSTKTALSYMLPRDVNHILSILKKPAAQESQDKGPILDKAAVKQCLPQSSEVVQLHNDDKPSEGTPQFEGHQATKATNKYDCNEAAKRPTADTDCSGDCPQPKTSPDNTATVLANTECINNNLESAVKMQGIVSGSPNKCKPSVEAAPSNICQPIHLACAMTSASRGTEKTRPTHQQPCEKLPETNASIKHGTSIPSNKPKSRRLFAGLASMNTNRDNVNTECLSGTLDCPSFDLGI